MDINKLTTHLNGTQATKQGQHSSGVPSANETRGSVSDKVSLDGYQFKKDEVLFARSEYNKQTQAAFEKLRAVKAELDEFRQAERESAEKAAQTEMGQKLNNPDVWEQIARKIMDS